MKCKSPLALLLFLFSLTTATAQTISERIRIIEDFMQTSNDSEFVTKYSALPFESYTARRYVLTYKFQPTDSLVFFHHTKGDIIGPYELDTLTAYVKVMRVDSTLRMRAGSIYLNPEKKGKGTVNKLSKEILASVTKGTATFEEMCLKHGDDSTAQTKGCDLGWFFQNAMVPEFEKAALKHKKGDFFVVDAKAGKYVVNLTEEPVKDRSAVVYTILYFNRID